MKVYRAGFPPMEDEMVKDALVPLPTASTTSDVIAAEKEQQAAAIAAVGRVPHAINEKPAVT